ncbi:toll/interleukin-1 receptor domain-containing protein [Streptomyces prunicolor]|uniref:toll/interleukin-1 receptor domain-containing protein n=1 Tax=Streptomyces prunicolor TaxID=67348 RepID=UPI00224DDAE6|nr:toll/interleukin-1 receptor domain-containing protein [Streptomyces prunicolor]MCX5233829.1 toll/interleukin-1 receptor domain-containing protein [Streptomyces prunicolor]
MDPQNNVCIDLTIVGAGSKRMDQTPNDFSIGAIHLRGWQVDRIEAPADGFDGDDTYLIKINYELDLELGLPRVPWFEMAFGFSSAGGQATVIDALPRSGTLTDAPKSYVLNRFLNLVPCEDGASAHAHLPAITDRIDAFGIGGPGVRWRHVSLSENGVQPGSYAAWAVLLVPSGEIELRVDFRARFDLAVGPEAEYRPTQSPTDFTLRLAAPSDAPGLATPSLAAGDKDWSDEQSGPSAFICYAHDSLQHKESARQFGNLLVRNGVEVHLDQWDETDRKNWATWALKLINEVDFVIILASPLCRAAFDGKITGTNNPGIRSEAALILDKLHRYRDEWTPKVLPVILPHELVDNVPDNLQPGTTDHYDIRQLTPDGIQGLLRAMTGVARHTRPPLGELPPSVRKPLSGTES